jgi:hypothetical protein
LGWFVTRSAFARDGEAVVLLDVACAGKEGAPGLVQGEIHVFPEVPARVLHVERTGTAEEEDGVLEARGVL